MCDRVFRLKLNTDSGECPRHFFNITKTHANSRPAKLDDVTDFPDPDAVRHIIRLHFLRATAMNTSTFVSDDRIAEGAPDNARPGKFVWSYCRSRTDIGLRIESQ